MAKSTLAVVLLLILSGCMYGKNLTPAQLDSIARLAEIQNVSGCAVGILEGSSPMVAGGGKVATCWGLQEKMTVNEINQLTDGYVINLQRNP